jgi:hypothetical protein
MLNESAAALCARNGWQVRIEILTIEELSAAALAGAATAAGSVALECCRLGRLSMGPERWLPVPTYRENLCSSPPLADRIHYGAQKELDVE